MSLSGSAALREQDDKFQYGKRYGALVERERLRPLLERCLELLTEHEEHGAASALRRELGSPEES